MRDRFVIGLVNCHISAPSRNLRNFNWQANPRKNPVFGRPPGHPFPSVFWKIWGEASEPAPICAACDTGRDMKHVVILSGAGLSAESGIPTFRASDGLWEGNRIEDVATPEAWARNPKLVLEFYNQRR
jgi:hypothetical protein